MVRAAELDGILSALADPTRRGVVDLLRRGPRCAGELAEALDMTPPAMSRHLRVLRRHTIAPLGRVGGVLGLRQQRRVGVRDDTRGAVAALLEDEGIAVLADL